jgi:hypothetical protein
MIYLFETKEGAKIELDFPMGTAPKIGDWIIRNGVEMQRVVSFHLDDGGIARKVHQYPYTSQTLPRNLEGCDHNKQGKPIITSQNHEKEIMSRHGYTKE